MDQVMMIVEQLCSAKPDRRPGGTGNDEAVDFIAQRWMEAGWETSVSAFDCLDWTGGPATLKFGDASFPLVPSPYGLGVETSGPIRVATSVDDLRSRELAGSILIVTGDLVSEPLTPKAFPFYGSAEHTEIIELLESGSPAVVIAVTGKHPELCGALDPFPWIEDGDFTVPAAAIRPSDAHGLLAAAGHEGRVSIEATRRPSTARNVIGRRGLRRPRIAVCAHIDSKPGTPGAVDNATGIAVLTLLAEALGQHGQLPIGVELLAVNGEDHFAGPGEVAWLAENEGRLDDIELFINIDGAGYRTGRTAYSLYNVEDVRSKRIRGILSEHDDLIEGPPWYQSDHAIFATQGRAALAFTTELVQEMLAELFHSEHDTPDQVEPDRIVSVAAALERLIINWSDSE